KAERIRAWPFSSPPTRKVNLVPSLQIRYSESIDLRHESAHIRLQVFRAGILAGSAGVYVRNRDRHRASLLRLQFQRTLIKRQCRSRGCNLFKAGKFGVSALVLLKQV